MAAITWYATSNLASVHQEMSETDPGAEAYASPVTGWVVSTGATNHGAFNSQTEATSFPDTTAPDGTIDTTNGDCLRSATTYNGTFAAADWNIHFACRANSNGGAQDGRMRCRLLRSANADGSSATEITAAQQQGGLVTNLATSATQTSTATFNPGSFTVTNEYVFIQLGWERTGAGGMSTSDVNMRVGSSTGTRIISSDFTPSSTPVNIAATINMVSTVGATPVRVRNIQALVDISITATASVTRLTSKPIAAVINMVSSIGAAFAVFSTKPITAAIAMSSTVGAAVTAVAVKSVAAAINLVSSIAAVVTVTQPPTGGGHGGSDCRFGHRRHGFRR